MPTRNGLIILDRDGVLDRMLDRDGTPDSPMCVAEVEVFPWVPAVLVELTRAGLTLAIASNQPAAAKGKATREELWAVHQAVVAGAEALGARIASSHICWHRHEDACSCRKPRPGLLEEALRMHAAAAADGAWMVGDRAVDVLAGAAAGLPTAFLSEQPVEVAFAAHAVRPTFQGRDLRDFGRFLLAGG